MKSNGRITNGSMDQFWLKRTPVVEDWNSKAEAHLEKSSIL